MRFCAKKILNKLWWMCWCVIVVKQLLSFSQNFQNCLLSRHTIFSNSTQLLIDIPLTVTCYFARRSSECYYWKDWDIYFEHNHNFHYFYHFRKFLFSVRDEMMVQHKPFPNICVMVHEQFSRISKFTI